MRTCFSQRPWCSFLAFAPLLLMQTGAAAATVTSVGTVAISIQSLNYNGTTYDVSFGTAIDDTFLGNMPDAYNVGLVMDAVLTANHITGVDDAPADPSSPEFFVDFGPTSAMAGFNGFGDSWEGIGQYFSNSTDITDYTAEFTVVPPGTPEPGTLATMLGGGLLIVLAEIKRRCQRDDPFTIAFR